MGHEKWSGTKRRLRGKPGNRGGVYDMFIAIRLVGVAGCLRCMIEGLVPFVVLPRIWGGVKAVVAPS